MNPVHPPDGLDASGNKKSILSHPTLPVPLPRPSKHRIVANATAPPPVKNTNGLVASKGGGVLLKRTQGRRKSCTELLCELTRLKTQQKYLECNQIKFKLENFQDLPPRTSPPASATASSKERALPATLPPASAETITPATAHLINEIGQLKIDLNAQLIAQREATSREVHELRQLVEAIRDDVTQSERLRLFSVASIRERIIAIDKQFDFLRAKNASRLEKLQQESLQLEQSVQLRLK